MEVEVQCVIFSLCLLFAITKARWQGRLGAVHPNLHLHLWHAGGEGCIRCPALSILYSQIPHKVALLKMMASGTKGDLAMTRVAVWAFCCMLPQFVIAIIALGRAFNRFGLHTTKLSFLSCSFSDMGILLKYPELFAAPLYIPVTFGRVRDEAGNNGKLSFSLRWTFVNMVATIAGIAALALYVELDPNVKWSPKYVATLMVVMAMAMVWMVPLMMASKYPDNILSVMYQQGVLDISRPERQFILEWQHGEERVVPLVQEEHTD